MKFSIHSLLLIVSITFLVVASASPIINKGNVINIATKSYNNDKRDLIDLHNSGGSKTTATTTTTTATSTATHTPTNLPASSDPEVIYGGNGITPQNGVVGAILIVLGLYLMVFGFRSFRITLAVCGFLTFGLITWVGMTNNQPYYGYVNNDVTIIAVPAGIGLLGAIIYAIFWNVSIYLVGALGGFALAMYILCCRSDLLITQVVARAAFLVALPVFMSFITFFAERYVLLFTFAFTGSCCFIVGIEFLAHTGYLAGIKSILDGNRYHRVVYSINTKVIVLIVFIGVVFLISFAWQYTYNKGQKFGVIFIEEVKEVKENPASKEEEGPGDPGKFDETQPHVEEQPKH
ncbi:uncharacterized protein B0P05DRAFT_468413 [Gilbertella persicaria]|uniref:uncharacterized protein n=1 Tax=Gilbertella persicaria TaxID=101096 RepID=UPI002220DFAB|nr:uncharacterized protein B0P05DRAFT_468413 [Gilbertella persicaria]KAI8082008.1 hypothetical protein B0P05DRAFT_468413 [Gilbertella persicaria]